MSTYNAHTQRAQRNLWSLIYLIIILSNDLIEKIIFTITKTNTCR